MPPIERVSIWYKHWQGRELEEAVDFIEGYDDGQQKPVERYEVEVRYNNGDAVRGQFKDKEAAIEFLRSYQPVLP